MGKEQIARVRFAAETKEFTEGLNQAKASMAALRAGLALNEAQFKNTGDKAAYLENKQNQLKAQLEENRKKQEALNAKLEAANRIYGENSTQAQRWETKLRKAETEQQQLEKQVSDTEDAIRDHAKAEEQAGTSLEKLNKKIAEQKNNLQDLKKQYANTVLEAGKNGEAAKSLEKEIASLNAELGRNEQKLREVSDASEEVGQAAGGGLTRCDQIFANLASGAITSVINKFKEAALAVVNLGMEFTASLSNVQALSGASAEEMGYLEASAKELGRSTIFSASQVSDAFGYMALAGWDTQEMLSGIDGVLNLAATSGMELADASDMVTDYLSAFGLEAQDAAGMVDMLAYAQANSNTTTEQLGDAYGNAASMMNTAGQSMQTTTAVLEAFANQGLKGSEAGTALSAMMRDITQKMKDGKIMIGDTAVEVQDANGNFRNMIDILADVEDATDGMGTAEKSAALMTTFTARSVKGVSMALTEGAENLKDYETQLNNCTGTAEDMADTMNDNLAGDMKALDSAAQGLGLQLFEYFEGPLRGAAQFATDALNAITDAITPQRSELQSFIEDVTESNRSVRDTLDAADTLAEEAGANVGKLEAYKNILQELAGRTDLNEYEQYQLKNAVEALKGEIPGLSAAFEEERGILDLTNSELENMFNNAEALAMQSAILSVQQESMEALATATVNAAMADSAAAAAQKDLDAAQAKNVETLDYLQGGYGDYYNEVLEAQIALDDANREHEEANTLMAEAQDKIDAQQEALSGLAEQYGVTQQGLEEYKEEAEKAAESEREAAEAAEEMTEASSLSADELEALAESTGMTTEELHTLAESGGYSADELEAIAASAAETKQAFLDLRDGVRESMEGSVSFMEAFNGGAELSAEQIRANLASAREGIDQWAADMQYLGENIGEEFSQSFYDELLEIGPSAANAVHSIAEELRNGSGVVKEISNEYVSAMDIGSKSDALARFSSAGKAVGAQYTTGMKDAEGEVEQSAGDLASGAMESMKSETDAGLSGIEGSFQSSFSGIRSVVSSEMSGAVRDLNGKIQEMRSALSVTLTGPALKLPHFKMTGAFDAKTNAVPNVSVSWYAKGAIFRKPTILNTASGFKGVGEAGAEAVLPIELLQSYISDAFAAEEKNIINVDMTVNGAEDPEAWATDFARSLRQQVRIG